VLEVAAAVAEELAVAELLELLFEVFVLFELLGLLAPQL
jgi:hypothetical protein